MGVHQKIARPKLRWRDVIQQDKKETRVQREEAQRLDNLENENLMRFTQMGRRPTKKIHKRVVAKRLDLYKLKSSSQNGLYSGERLREYGVKFCKGNELSDARPGKAKRELHCFVMKLIYTAVIVKKKHCEKIQDCQCKQTERP